MNVGEFIHKHIIKFLIAGVVIYAMGVLSLPGEYALEKVFVPHFDFVVGPKHFAYAYFLFVTPLSLIPGALIGSFLHLNGYSTTSLIGFFWVILASVYGFVSYLYDESYLLSSICLFLTGMFLIVIPYIEYKYKDK